MSATDSTPRRGIAIDESVDPIEVITTAPTSSRPARARRKLGKGAVAAVLASTLAAGALFTIALTSRTSETPALESVNADAAVPVAAQEATQMGFANRAADVSRNMVRDGVTDAVAEETAKERAADIDDSANAALETQSTETAEERIKLMDEDLKKVEAQAAQLKKEAEEAARKLEEARKAAEAAKKAAAATKNKKSGGAAPAAVETELSDDDVKNLSTSGASMPIKSNYRVGAHFGKTGSWSRYHTGQDFPAPSGTPVYAVASGVALSPTAGGWAGTNVVIQHDSGAVLYAHLSRSVVSPGQSVAPGQLVGYVGNTGRSFGAHLHFEYYPNGTTPGDVYSATNPMSFLQRIGAAG